MRLFLDDRVGRIFLAVATSAIVALLISYFFVNRHRPLVPPVAISEVAAPAPPVQVEEPIDNDTPLRDYTRMREHSEMVQRQAEQRSDRSSGRRAHGRHTQGHRRYGRRPQVFICGWYRCVYWREY